LQLLGQPNTVLAISAGGCEAALIAVNVTTRAVAQTVLFFSEPTGSGRTGLTLRCSLDGASGLACLYQSSVEISTESVRF
jgi:hypothetical protein